MNPIATNLRLLCRRRSFLFWYGLILLSVLPLILTTLVLPNKAAAGLTLSFLLSTLTGMLTGAHEAEMLSLPFSFTLPDHRRVVAGSLVRLAVGTSIVLGLLHAFHPAARGVGTVLLPAAATALHLAFFLGSSTLLLRFPRGSAFMGILPITLMLLAHTRFPEVLDALLSNTPLATALVSFAAAWCLQRHLQQHLPAWHRERCGTPVVTLFNSLDMRRTREAQEKRRLERALRKGEKEVTWVERLCLPWLEARRGSFRLRSAVGCLYEAAGGTSGVGWLSGLLVCIPIVILYGYWQQGRPIGWLYAGTMFLGVGVSLPVERHPLFQRRRQDVFLGSLAVLGTMTLLGTIGPVCLTALTTAIETAVPPITINGQVYAWHGAPWFACWLPPIVIPLGALLQLLLPPNAFRILPVAMIFPFMAILNITAQDTAGPQGTLFAVATALVWILVPAVLAWRCFRTDLCRWQ